MKFRGAIFDLDGTLFDSTSVWENIDIAFLSKRNKNVPSDYLNKVAALSLVEAAKYTISYFELNEEIEDIVYEWKLMAADEYAHKVKLKPYAEDYLRMLKSNGVKLAVATGLPRELFTVALTNLGILTLFDTASSVDDVSRGKLFADVYFHAAENLGLSPSDCVVFEDVPDAVTTAKNAGLTVYAMYDKHSSAYSELLKATADGYFMDYREAPTP